MAALTDEEFRTIRTWLVWLTDADRATSDLIFANHGNIWACIEEGLRERLMQLIADPAQFSVNGEYSQNTTANIEALQGLLAEATRRHRLADGTIVNATGHLLRLDPTRGVYTGRG